MSIEEILMESEEGMEKAIEYMTHEFASVRTGKASPSLVENVDVDAYGGTRMKLKQLALISTPEARMLVVQPFDASTMKDIERALSESRLGINPIVDGKLIRLPIPELSEERRKDLAKAIKGMAEETRIRVRTARREGIDTGKKLLKTGDISEDSFHDLEDQIQKLTAKYTGTIDEHFTRKEAEIMQI